MWKNAMLWFNSQMQGINAYLQAHPKVKNWLDGLEKAVIASVLSYLAMIVGHLSDGTPLPVNLSHGLLVGVAGGLLVVISGSIKAYSQNLHDIILANTQDNVMASDKDVPLTTSSVLTPVANPTPTQGGVDVKKIGMLVMGFLLMSSSVFAWELPGTHFGMGGLKLSASDVPAEGECVLAAMPLVDGQYSFATASQPDSFNIGAFEAIGVFNLKPGTGQNVNVSSILFVGAGINTNLSDFFHNQFNAPLVISWGVELGVPAAQGIPQMTVGIQGQFDQPGHTVTLGTAVPLEAVVDWAIHVFSKL